MREYEITFIIQPKLEEAAREQLIERVLGWISGGDDSAEKPTVNHWGMRSLAYPIKKFTEGYYVLVETKMAPENVKELERNLEIAEDVLRYLVVRKDS
ncbi:MAG: 30S ribosomal protein S6 [Chloroflexi bacterium]|nr:MAG: 30S ribosomal protein S6 [Chloroflexota bacterium]